MGGLQKGVGREARGLASQPISLPPPPPTAIHPPCFRYRGGNRAPQNWAGRGGSGNGLN